MAKPVVQIEISFPVAVELSREVEQKLDALLTELCRDWEKKNPGQIMWPFGIGSKMLVNPMMLSDDEPIPFDDSVLSIEIAAREAYEGERNYCQKGTA